MKTLASLPAAATLTAAEACGKALQSSVVSTFDAQTTPGGDAWPARKIPRDSPLLVDSQALRKSLVDESALAVSDGGFRYATGVPYAAIQNNGAPAKGIPSRRFWPTRDEGQGAIRPAAEAAIRALLARQKV